jgi:coenzyme PQQ precursor peptide PqqA
VPVPQRCAFPLIYSAVHPCRKCAKKALAVAGAYVLLLCERSKREDTMAWTTPVLVEVCVGLEINGYLPPEF